LGQYKAKYQMRWLCRCDCGQLRAKSVTTGQLRSGGATHCGCQTRVSISRAKVKHGKCMRHTSGPTREYRAWRGMIDRCENPRVKAFANYGGRGIRVCRRWRTSFAAFFEDMGPCPGIATIDRVRNSGNYTPLNCRWASYQEQANNTRRNRLLCYAGREQTVSQWARELNVNVKTLMSRLADGWSVQRTLSTAIRSNQC